MTGAAFAAVLLATAGPAAVAQSNNRSGAGPTAAQQAQSKPGSEAMPHRVMPGQLRFSQMNGATVYGPNDKSVGDINNVVLDPNGRVAAVVIKIGGFLGIGGKTAAVAMKEIRVAPGKDGKLRFTVDMTQQQLKSAQAYDLTPPHSAPATASGSSAPPAERPHN
jgi:sporulation protein YlmC with PRC-barrel domain